MRDAAEQTSRPGATRGIPGPCPPPDCLCPPKRKLCPPPDCLCPPKRKLCPPKRGLCPKEINRLGDSGAQIEVQISVFCGWRPFFFFWRSPVFGRKNPLNLRFRPENPLQFQWRPFFFFNVRTLFYIVSLLMMSQMRLDNNEKNVESIIVQCTTTVQNRIIFSSL